MDFSKLNPWNWFKHEEADKGRGEVVPVKHDEITIPRKGAEKSNVKKITINNG